MLKKKKKKQIYEYNEISNKNFQVQNGKKKPMKNLCICYNSYLHSNRYHLVTAH